MPGMLDLISVLFGRGVHGPRAQSLSLSLSLRTESVWRGKPHSPPVTLYSALDARARVVVAEALDGRGPDC